MLSSVLETLLQMLEIGQRRRWQLQKQRRMRSELLKLIVSNCEKKKFSSVCAN